MKFFPLVFKRSSDAIRNPQHYPTRGRRKLWAYIRQAHRFRRQLLAARKVSFPDRPGLTVILTSFKREENLPFIVESVLALPYVTEVILTNNNPAQQVDVARFTADPRFRLISQEQPTACGYRYDLARASSGERFIVIDDDIFLSPQQVDLLYSRFLENPDVPHGVQGQVWESDPESEAPRPFVGEREVDVLNRVYLVNRKILNTMYHILGKFGLHNAAEVHNAEDLFVSFSGTGRPRIHDVGKWVDCPTGYKTDTAIFLNRPNFHEERNLIFNHLQRLRLDPDYSPDISRELTATVAAVNRTSFQG